eukprot:4598233-Pyramimonas_sp.AAC.1
MELARSRQGPFQADDAGSGATRPAPRSPACPCCRQGTLVGRGHDRRGPGREARGCARGP